MQYCSLQHRPCFYHLSHPQLGIVVALAPSLHSFWSFSPLISSSILGTYQPGEFLFQYPILLPFHTVHGVLRGRILKWFAIPFSSGPHSVRYDRNQIPYDYTVEVRNRFKGLDLIDTVPDELWMEIPDIVQEAGIKTIPMQKKCQKAKWLSGEALQIAVKRREVKRKDISI